MHLPLRPRIVCAAFSLLVLAGCLFDPAPETLGPVVTDGASTAPHHSPDQAAPLDSLTYTSTPVPTGLLADMVMLAGYLYEPHDNWWNVSVKNAPLDPNSAQIIQTIQSYEANGARLHPDMASDAGIPYCIVDDETPLVTVDFADPNESDAGAPGAPAGYPIPEAANTDSRYIENGGRSDGDRHLILFDKDQRVAFELVQAQYSNGRWSASYGAAFKLDSNYRRPNDWTSADAAGLCMLAGLLRYDEVYGPWPIRHALRVSLRHTNGHVWPASHTGATDAGAPPLGTRLRLKRSVDTVHYPPHMQKILIAMKTYGLIVADRGTSMYIQGTMDARWDNGVINPVFHDFDAADFEVIQMGWKPGS